MRKGRHEIQPKGTNYQPKAVRMVRNSDQIQEWNCEVKDDCKDCRIEFAAANTIKPIGDWRTGACGAELGGVRSRKESNLDFNFKLLIPGLETQQLSLLPWSPRDKAVL